MDGHAPPLKRPEPVDERGDLKETNLVPDNSPRDQPPRLSPLQFPTDRLPQLGVEIVQRLPGVGENSGDRHHDPQVNHNINPSLPLPVVPEKVMFNLWHNTQTQTEVRWKPPENKSQFSGMLYQIEIKKGNEDWVELTENRQNVYRIYYVDGVALFGRHRIGQESNVQMVRLRIRPVGENTYSGKVEKKIGPWSDEILFSLEGNSN